MWEVDKDIIQQLSDQCGSTYMAIQFIASAARKLCRGMPKGVIESQVITWVLTGHHPDVELLRQYYFNQNPELGRVNDYLCYIEDKAVARSVKNSYMMSAKNQHLIYRYEDALDEYARSRVRVITRMLWASM